MTQIEEAKILAKELIEEIESSVLDSNSQYLSKGVANKLAITTCNSIITTLGSMKGMGKISKLKLWKLVKLEIESYD